MSRTAVGIVLALTGFCGAAEASQSADKIGIFALKAIRSVPLDVELLSKAKDPKFPDVNIEQIRFTVTPGVRALAILTYKNGAKNAPGYELVERYRLQPLSEVAENGFFGIVVAPLTGNKDPKAIDSVGGPTFRQPFNILDQYLADKNQSYVYLYTVALLRCHDYLATRPECNLSDTVVTGFSWAGTLIGLIHAIDDRPACYFNYHGLGFYVDDQGLSAGKPLSLQNKSGHAPLLLTKKLYDMYCPAAYAGYGTKPMYVCAALDDFYSRLDAVIETYSHLHCPKAFAFVPNRQNAVTSRNEIGSYAGWQQYWMGFTTDVPSTLGEGTVKVEERPDDLSHPQDAVATTQVPTLIYECSIDSKVPLRHADVLVSYGKPGDWMGRTWHRFPLSQVGDVFDCVIPVYDPLVPLYAVAQIESDKYGDIANGPQYVEPLNLGVRRPTAYYPNVLFNPVEKDDLYLRTGDVQWSEDGPDGKGSAVVSPGLEGTIIFQNVDGILWASKKTLSIWLKGDGQPGPILAYLMSNPNYTHDIDKKNCTVVELVPKGATFTAGWKEYSVPLTKIPMLDTVSSIAFDSNKRRLQIGPIILTQ